MFAIGIGDEAPRVTFQEAVFLKCFDACPQRALDCAGAVRTCRYGPEIGRPGGGFPQANLVQQSVDEPSIFFGTRLDSVRYLDRDAGVGRAWSPEAHVKRRLDKLPALTPRKVHHLLFAPGPVYRDARSVIGLPQQTLQRNAGDLRGHRVPAQQRKAVLLQRTERADLLSAEKLGIAEERSTESETIFRD